MTDGKAFFCVAVNLLELDDLKLVIRQIELDEELNGLPIKEKVAYMKKQLENIADVRQMILKLRKKR